MAREVGQASEDELQSVEDMDENILLCKFRFFHQMGITALREQTWGDEVDYVCEVCGCERYDSYDPNGELLSRYYRPAARSKVVGGRMTSADFRVELLRRYKLGGMGLAHARKRRRLNPVREA
jgi:hypothetical protein